MEMLCYVPVGAVWDFRCPTWARRGLERLTAAGDIVREILTVLSRPFAVPSR